MNKQAPRGYSLPESILGLNTVNSTISNVCTVRYEHTASGVYRGNWEAVMDSEGKTLFYIHFYSFYDWGIEKLLTFSLVMHIIIHILYPAT